MKKLIAWPLTRALYYIGHGAYLWLDSIDDDENTEPGRFFRLLFRVYQRSMCASLNVNDWGRCEFWSRPKAHKVYR